MRERVADAYRRPAPLDGGARARLDHALAETPAPRTRRATATWLAPVGGWTLRPVPAIAAGLVLLATGFVIGRVVPRPGPDDAPGRPPEAVATASRDVRFVLVAPAASRVTVVGDFNGWDPVATPMERQGDDTWIARVPLSPGRHLYAFVMDGQRWISDPRAPLTPANEFGVQNSVIVVGGPL